MKFVSFKKVFKVYVVYLYIFGKPSSSRCFIQVMSLFWMCSYGSFLLKNIKSENREYFFVYVCFLTSVNLITVYFS